MRILITGASGFVGGHVVRHVLDAGHCVRGLSRKFPRGDRRHEPAEYVEGVNVADPSTLTPAMFQDVDAIVHLVGIIQQAPDGQTFQRIHVEGTRNVIETARAASFEGRIVYLSAIGSDADSPSEYSRTKARAEAIVRESGFDFTILRPSLILGKDGEFIDQMKDLVLYGGLPVHVPFPVIPIPGSGNNLFQPLAVDDLGRCIVQCCEDQQCSRQTYEVGGSERVSFNGMIAAISQELAVHKPAVHAPLPVLRIVAGIMEAVLPKPPVTRDQLKNLSKDNVTDSTAIETVFGIRPQGFSHILPQICGKT